MNIRLAGLGLFLLLFGRVGFSQDCDNFTITVSEDTTLCTPSEPVPVAASFSATPFNFQWSPGAGLADPSAAVTTATPATTQTYTITAQAIGENLIFNGDFELGNAGFTTDYGQGSGGPNGPLHNEGEYLISNNPMATHEDFAPCGPYHRQWQYDGGEQLGSAKRCLVSGGERNAWYGLCLFSLGRFSDYGKPCEPAVLL